MGREVSQALTLTQARAIRTRLRNHFSLPQRATTIGAKCAPIPLTYSPGAIGWSDQAVPLLRIPSRNEIRLVVAPIVKVLIGQQVDGSTLNLTVVDIDTLKSNDEDEESTA